MKTILLVLSLLAALPAASQERKITFTLDFIALGRHAPWYVPIAKGYYKAEGLDVSVVPSKGTADAIKAVESGIAQLGFIDVPSLVAAGGAAAAIASKKGRRPTPTRTRISRPECR